MLVVNSQTSEWSHYFERLQDDFCFSNLMDVRPVRGAIFGLFGSKFGPVKRAVCAFTHEQLVTPFKTQIGSPGVKDNRKIYRPTDCHEMSPTGWDWHLKMKVKKNARSILYLLSSKSIQEKISKGPVPVIVPPITVAPVSELGTGFSHLKYKSSHWIVNWKNQSWVGNSYKTLKQGCKVLIILDTFHINAFSYLCIHFTEVLIIP